MTRGRGRQTSGLSQAWEGTAFPHQGVVLSQRTEQHSVLDPAVVPRGPSAPGFPHSLGKREPSMPSPDVWVPSAGGQGRHWALQARLPRERPSPLRQRRQSGTVLLLFKTSHCGRLVCLCLSAQRAEEGPFKGPAVVFARAHTQNPTPGPVFSLSH